MLLFEYGDWIKVARASALRRQLRDLWGERLFVAEEHNYLEDTEDRRFQPFLNFDGELIRANNFVGFIQNEDEVIEIFPKVFKGKVSAAHKALMLRHIFYWFRYCRRWRFPFNQANLDPTDFDQFPELIINLIATLFLETISNQPLSLYQPIEETLYSPRGAINFKRYIANGLSHGNPHKIDCDHEPFLFDNRLNRVIKFCSRLLLTQTYIAENLRILQEIIFILDEVEDVPITIQDLENVSINPFFSEYLQIVESCKMVLLQQLYSSRVSDLSQWCLLFPMEYIFEDFIAGFLESRFSDRWKIEYQRSNRWLSERPKAFQMQHDILLTSKDA